MKRAYIQITMHPRQKLSLMIPLMILLFLSRYVDPNIFKTSQTIHILDVIARILEIEQVNLSK